MNEPFLDNPVGHIASGRVNARVSFSTNVPSIIFLATEDSFIFETEGGDSFVPN